MSKNQNQKTIIQKQTKVALQIKAEEPTEIEYMHAILCHVSLPKKALDKTYYEKTTGTTGIRIEAGTLFIKGKFVQFPLPYGSRPRLIMANIFSEAIRTKSKDIYIQDSMHSFMKSLGINTSGREYARFKKQMYCLAACRMTLGFEKDVTIKTQPIQKFDAWLTQDSSQKVMWPGTIQLSDEFYTTLIDHAVPLDKRALNALKHSALCLDIYFWLAHRLHRITKKKGIELSWENLRFQFGQEYSNIKDFKKKFKTALKQVKAVYPDAKIQIVYGGIVLKNSPPPVKKLQIATSQPARLSS